MNRFPSVLCFVAAVALSATALTAQQPRPRTSPHETFSAFFGDSANRSLVTITYGRPYTKDPKTGEPRKIWGGMVPWDKAYTLYLVPSEGGPTKLAFSTNIGKWGAPVDEGHDLVRVDVKKDPLEKPVDQLTLAVEKDPAGGGVLKVMWENTQFSVPFTVKK